MNDLISRREAIDRINKQREHLQPDIYPQDIIGDAAYRICAEFIERLPSAQPNEFRKQGEWDMFELITSAWYGKQYYFKEENGMAYSRKSHKTMTVHDAILEFIREIGDE